jgi:hypothetical protein
VTTWSSKQDGPKHVRNVKVEWSWVECGGPQAHWTRCEHHDSRDGGTSRSYAPFLSPTPENNHAMSTKFSQQWRWEVSHKYQMSRLGPCLSDHICSSKVLDKSGHIVHNLVIGFTEVLDKWGFQINQCPINQVWLYIVIVVIRILYILTASVQLLQGLRRTGVSAQCVNVQSNTFRTN